jgi:protein tyrosine/serine phosphatase
MTTSGTSSFNLEFRDIAEEGEWRTVIHCRAGKDRTGVLIAVLLNLLGVSDEQIAEDYSLTGLAMPKIMNRLRQSSAYMENVKKLPDEMYSAKKETMLKFLELVKGLIFANTKIADKFLKAINDFTSTLKIEDYE